MPQIQTLAQGYLNVWYTSANMLQAGQTHRKRSHSSPHYFALFTKTCFTQIATVAVLLSTCVRLRIACCEFMKKWNNAHTCDLCLTSARNQDKTLRWHTCTNLSFESTQLHIKMFKCAPLRFTPNSQLTHPSFVDYPRKKTAVCVWLKKITIPFVYARLLESKLHFTENIL